MSQEEKNDWISVIAGGVFFGTALTVGLTFIAWGIGALFLFLVREYTGG